jgi:uncharacterized protein (DUF1800 family)
MKRASLLLVALACPLLAFGRGADSLRPLPPEQWDVFAAAHLLRRAAFGGTPEQVRALAAMTPAQAVERLINPPTTYSPPPPLIHPLLDDDVDRATMTPQQRQNFARQRRQAERQTMREVQLWWLERLAASPRPFEERMTLMWHGHFTSGFREVRNPLYLYEQNQLLREHALAHFGDLVLQVSRDPAMLVYLDGRRNRREQPNENYARELLELFTLGEGNYKEADIKEAARAFTGWGLDEHGFRFRARQHDYGQKTFLGVQGKHDGIDVIAVILEQRECSEHLAGRLLKTFVRPDPAPRLVRAFAREIRQLDYELEPIMRVLLTSEAFYHPSARGTLIKSPVELLVGTVRNFALPLEDLTAAEAALRQMGQQLFQPPNVKGWDGGPKWITTATLFNRYNTVTELIKGTRARPGARVAMRTATRAMTDGDQTPRQIPQAQPALDVMAWLHRYGLRDPEQIVDFFSAHLLTQPLESVKRSALISYLRSPQNNFDIDSADAGPRVRRLLQLMVSTPEYQLH